MTLDDIKARCFIDDEGCWIWRGGASKGVPRVWAPNHQKEGSPKEGQVGRRAVWHVMTGKPIPVGKRIYGTCMKPLCLNPDCARCGTGVDVGKFTVKTGRFKGQPKRIAANRLIGRKRSTLSPALIAEIQQSSESIPKIAKRLNIGKGPADRARRGEATAFSPIASPFAGLLA